MTIASTFGVSILALICLVCEWLPVHITALSVAVVLALPGDVTLPRRDQAKISIAIGLGVILIFARNLWCCPMGHYLPGVQVISVG